MGLTNTALILNGEEMMTWKIFIFPELAIVQQSYAITGVGVYPTFHLFPSLWIRLKALEIGTVNSRVLRNTI